MDYDPWDIAYSLWMIAAVLCGLAFAWGVSLLLATAL